MDVPTSAIVILVCLALSAFFSGSETALLRLHAGEVEHDARAARGPAAVAVRELLGSTSRLLVTILFGNNVVNILAASVASAVAVALLGEGLGIAVATLVLSFVVLVFCEVLPKAIAARAPRPFAHAVALPLYLVHQALRPVHILYDRSLEPLVKRISGGDRQHGHAHPEEVLRMAMRAAVGQPPGSPLAIIGAAAAAADTTVEEIMVPASEVIAFPVTAEPTVLLERVLEQRYTRFPLYEGSLDRVAGVVHLKDLSKFVRAGGTDLREIAKPVQRVPEGKKILELLTEMQRSLLSIAIVKDEFGTTQGLVSREDILEEIVGELRDEFDSEELLRIRSLGEGVYQALGQVRVADFNRETGCDVPAARGETLGGLVFHELGRAPHGGDLVRVPGYELRVLEASGTRVERVRVRRRGTARAGEQ